MRRMLDLFCGRLGWSKAFLAHGWEVVGVDLVDPPDPWPPDFDFVRADVRHLGFAFGGLIVDDGDYRSYGPFDFICASSPCEQFSVHCMKFTKKKDHPYPEMGIEPSEIGGVAGDEPHHALLDIVDDALREGVAAALLLRVDLAALPPAC